MGTSTTNAKTLPSIINTSSNTERSFTNTLNPSIKINLLLIIANVEAFNRLNDITNLDSTDRYDRRQRHTATLSIVGIDLVTLPAQQFKYRGQALVANKGFVTPPIAVLTAIALGTANCFPCSYISWDPACATGACVTRDCRMSSPLAIKV